MQVVASEATGQQTHPQRPATCTLLANRRRQLHLCSEEVARARYPAACRPETVGGMEECRMLESALTWRKLDRALHSEIKSAVKDHT
jgi:hypothetical protein